MLVRTFLRLLSCVISFATRSSLLAHIIDAISFFALYPSTYILDTVSRRFLHFYRFKTQSSITNETNENWLSWIKCLILAPFTAFCILGIFLRILRHFLFPRQRYCYVQSKIGEQQPSSSSALSFACCDISPTQEKLSFDETIRQSVRHALTAQRLVRQHPYITQASSFKNRSVANCFPNADFLCLRNVWGQHLTSRLVESLASRFNYFVVDKGDYKLKSNICLFGSGLFLASKFPIITFQFTHFERQDLYSGMLFCDGVICAKVKVPGKGVGFISYFTRPLFADGSSESYNNLTEVLSAINAFRQKNIQKNEVVLIDVLCGDFDLNGESTYESHPVFNQYTEIFVNDSLDHSWTNGLFEPRKSTGNAHHQLAGKHTTAAVKSCSSPNYETTVLKVQLSEVMSTWFPEDDLLTRSKRQSFDKTINSRVLLRKDLPVKIISLERF